MPANESRPNDLWPIGTSVEFLDAWGRNPVRGKIIRHINEREVLIEDAHEVRYCGQTWRITTEPPSADDDDLLGEAVPEKSTKGGMFEDLLG